MGYGDELMVTGQARRLNNETGRRVVVLDRRGNARWHPLWLGNPRILRPEVVKQAGPVEILRNGPGMRPYVRSFTKDRWRWRAFDCPPGEIYFTDGEEQVARARRDRLAGRVVIEPNVKRKASPNKHWPHWRELVEAYPDIPWIQLGPARSRVTLPGVPFLETQTFRTAAICIREAAGYCGPEGGLHHAAAAVGRPAVVLFGGFISPAQTGYDFHTNIFTGDRPCGWRTPCRHCAQAMAAITVDQVGWAVRDMLDRARSAPSGSLVAPV
jgi:hypothetical protein